MCPFWKQSCPQQPQEVRLNRLKTPSISSDTLATFLKVAETASVSGAANRLGIGKSLVSKRVAQLEGSLGATLFSRSTRKVVLTPAGEAYLDFARRALAEMAAGEERLRALRSDLTGRIRLTAPVSWGQQVLSKCLPEFLKLHSAIEIDLQLSDRMMDIAFERVDIALRWSPTAAHHLQAVVVANVTALLVAAPAYLAVAGTPLVPQALSSHACMCYWRGTADDQWVLERGGQTSQVAVTGRYHVDNPESVVDGALAGLGIAMLPNYLCNTALAQGQLVRILADWAPVTKYGTQITALATPERMRLSRNRALLAFLSQTLNGPQDPTAGA